MRFLASGRKWTRWTRWARGTGWSRRTWVAGRTGRSRRTWETGRTRPPLVADNGLAAIPQTNDSVPVADTVYYTSILSR